MSSPISQTVRRKLINILEGRPSEPTDLIELLQDENVTAWGVKNQDYRYFRQMAPGDYHILRTEGSKPSNRFYEYLQQVDLTVGDEEVKAPFRKEISEVIWDEWEYEFLWFSNTDVEQIHCSERMFDRLVQQANPGFQTQDFFSSRNVNFRPLSEDVIQYFGGDNEFIQELVSI